MKVTQRFNSMHWKSNISHKKQNDNVEKFEKVMEMIASVECNEANKTMKYLKVLATEIRKEFTAKKQMLNSKQPMLAYL